MRTVEHGLAMERFLCEAFAEALGVPRVAPDDHFFDLGRHSLLVMRVVADIEAGLGIHLPPSAIFDHPTASRLTHHLAAIELEAAPMRAASTSTAPDAPSALSPLQRGMWFLDQGVGRHAAYL